MKLLGYREGIFCQGRYLKTFPMSCGSLYLHQQCMWVRFFLCHQHLVCFTFSILAILVCWVVSYLVFIHSPMANMSSLCLSPMCLYSVIQCLFKNFVNLVNLFLLGMCLFLVFYIFLIHVL